VNRHAKSILILSTGWVFIVVGIVGLFIPLMQGILCILIGLMLLSSEYVWAQNLLIRLRKRFPKLGLMADKAAAKAKGWMRRLSGQRPND
jgi:hypothetical protein